MIYRLHSRLKHLFVVQEDATVARRQCSPLLMHVTVPISTFKLGELMNLEREDPGRLRRVGGGATVELGRRGLAKVQEGGRGGGTRTISRIR